MWHSAFPPLCTETPTFLQIAGLARRQPHWCLFPSTEHSVFGQETPCCADKMPNSVTWRPTLGTPDNSGHSITHNYRQHLQSPASLGPLTPHDTRDFNSHLREEVVCGHKAPYILAPQIQDTHTMCPFLHTAVPKAPCTVSGRKLDLPFPVRGT